MDGLWRAIIYASTLYVGSYMTTVFKGYLLIIGTISIVMGIIGMFVPDFTWYPAFENVDRGTSAANFIRTMSGVFVASGYILIRFIFSSSKVQLGHVLIYLVAFMLVGKMSGLFYEGFQFHDIVTTTLGFFTLVGLIVIHKHLSLIHI